MYQNVSFDQNKDNPINYNFQATFIGNFSRRKTQHRSDEFGRDSQKNSDGRPGSSNQDMGHIGTALIDCGYQTGWLRLDCSWNVIHIATDRQFTLACYSLLLRITNISCYIQFIMQGCIEYHLFKYMKLYYNIR